MFFIVKQKFLDWWNFPKHSMGENRRGRCRFLIDLQVIKKIPKCQICLEIQRKCKGNFHIGLGGLLTKISCSKFRQWSNNFFEYSLVAYKTHIENWEKVSSSFFFKTHFRKKNENLRFFLLLLKSSYKINVTIHIKCKKNFFFFFKMFWEELIFF